MHHILLVLVACVLAGCGHSISLTISFDQKSEVVNAKDAALFEDRLTYSLPQGSRCPAKWEGELLSEQKFWSELPRERLEHVIKRLSLASLSFYPEVSVEAATQLERLKELYEHVAADEDVEVSFLPSCEEQGEELRVRLVTSFVRPKAECGIGELTFQWLDAGPRETPLKSWLLIENRKQPCATRPTRRVVSFISLPSPSLLLPQQLFP